MFYTWCVDSVRMSGDVQRCWARIGSQMPHVIHGFIFSFASPISMHNLISRHCFNGYLSWWDSILRQGRFATSSPISRRGNAATFGFTNSITRQGIFSQSILRLCWFTLIRSIWWGWWTGLCGAFSTQKIACWNAPCEVISIFWFAIWSIFGL